MAEVTGFRDVMKASYDYAATAEDELTVKDDQLLYLLGQLDDDWSKVQAHTPLEALTEAEPAVGLVPAAYIEPAVPLYRAYALYDYEPNGEGEIAMQENDKMNVYLKEDEWVLVKLDGKDKGHQPFIGYVPANYIEEGEGEPPAAEVSLAPIRSVPSPQPQPSTPYLDPAERAAAAVKKMKDDPVQTWSVSEIDKKGKKKKGTLGVGNGSIFFASESDKAPVQQWSSSSVSSVHIGEDKHKLVNLEINSAGSNLSLQFNAGSKADAEAVVDKIERSKRLANGDPASPTESQLPSSPVIMASPKPSAPDSTRFLPPPSHPHPGLSPSPSGKSKGVRWDTAPPAEIAPDPQGPLSDEEEPEEEAPTTAIRSASGGTSIALAMYDFDADGEDELSMKEGEKLTVLDKEGNEEWWRCRNSKGKEGVVPASYLEVDSIDAASGDNGQAEAKVARAAEEARKEQERAAAAAAKAKRLADDNRRKREQESRQAEQLRRQEEAQAQEMAQKQQQQAEERRVAKDARREVEQEERKTAPNGKAPSNGTKKSVLFHSIFKFAGTPGTAAGTMGLPDRDRSRSPTRSTKSNATESGESRRGGPFQNPSLTNLVLGQPRYGSRARSASPIGTPRTPHSRTGLSSDPSTPTSFQHARRPSSPASLNLSPPRGGLASSSSSIRSASTTAKSYPPSRPYASPPSKSRTLPLSPASPSKSRTLPPSYPTPPPKSRTLPPSSAPFSYTAQSSPPRPKVPVPHAPSVASKPFSYTAAAAQAPFNILAPSAQAPFSYLNSASSAPPFLLKPRNITHGRAQSKDLPGRPSLDKPKPTNTRIWHDRSGQFKVDAQFLGVHSGKIRLHKSNGVIIEVPEEKMSAADMEYIRQHKANRMDSQPNEDDVPLGELPRRPTTVTAPPAPRPVPTPRRSTIDWFEFFLSAGCDVDDCTRYGASFERDKIDEAILPDIKPETLRALGLREGDIIRVMKKIEERNWKTQPPRSNDPRVQEQMRKDAEFAMKLQEQEYSGNGRTTPNRNNTGSPGLFAGPGGALRNNTRRGRPPPTKSATLGVDTSSIANASEQLSRTSTPNVAVSSPATTSGATGARTSTTSTAAPVSGFDDDAWTPRPASAAGKPATSPPVAPPRAPSVPVIAPTPPTPPAPAPPVVQPSPTQQSSGGAIQRPATSNPPAPKLPDQFDVLAKIGTMRPPSAPVPPTAPPAFSPLPVSFQNGLGMGSSPAPIGSYLNAQQTGVLSPLHAVGGPRAPFAPVPANEGLLKPLIPTNTGFNSFIPTRPGATPSPSFLTQQPTGFNPGGFGQSSIQPLQANPTGFGTQPSSMFPNSYSQPPSATSSGFSTLSGFTSSSGYHTPSPIPPQPTGFGGGAGPFGNQNAISNPGNNFLNTLQSQPTGFQSGPPNVNPPQQNNSPANVFASMKAGSFANSSAPQGSDKYDALRPQPTGWNGLGGLQPQPTGFPQQNFQQPGFQPGFQNGFQQPQGYPNTGYGYQ